MDDVIIRNHCAHERLFALYTVPTTDLDAVHRAVEDAITLLQRCPELDLPGSIGDARIAPPGESAS